MRAMVTGGTGFFGFHSAQALLEAGCQLSAVRGLSLVGTPPGNVHSLLLNYYYTEKNRAKNLDKTMPNSTVVNAFAQHEANGELSPMQYELPEIEPEQVDMRVEYCGVCHSDLSMLQNAWYATQYPFVPGHEVIGTVEAVGERVKNIAVGDRVGLGWFSSSCMHCDPCMRGDHNLCTQIQMTIMGRHGGFADRVRCHWAWAVPLPDGIEAASAGPLFCAGVTVFNPLVEFGVKPTDRVGVIGIGGLGHLALQILNKWGCEVIAFSSSPAKAEEAKALGAHRVINSRDSEELRSVAGSLDFIMNTTDVTLDWNTYMGALGPKGRLHTVGMVAEPMAVMSAILVQGQKSLSGSPMGSPASNRKMLEFCGRHNIAPVIEEFDLAQVNDAVAHLEQGKARYRIVLKVQ